MKKIYKNWQYSQHVANYTAYEGALLQLFYGARWDGDLMDKSQIGKLVSAGHAERWNGFSLITKEGVIRLVENGLVRP